jgi:hypothetical protein
MVEQIIEEIKNPPQRSLSVKTTSVLISRMVKSDKKDEFKTVILRFFDINNPHLTQAFPKKVIVYNNTEKARLMGLNVSYYLEGNDLVINDLEEVFIERENNRLYIKGKQRNVNRR